MSAPPRSVDPGGVPRPLDRPRCPLCGAPNQCAPAASGSFSTPCWCTDVRFDPAVLANLPPGQRGQACLCPTCAGVGTPAPARPRTPDER